MLLTTYCIKPLRKVDCVSAVIKTTQNDAHIPMLIFDARQQKSRTFVLAGGRPSSYFLFLW